MWSSRSASALVLGVLALLAPAGSAHGAAPRVDAMVVGKTGWIVGPKSVRVSGTRVTRCRLRAGLPIGVLRELRQPFRARGSCRALYVSEVRGEHEQGAGGWVYKVGRALPGRSASDPSARLRTGQRVTWFWCRRAGNCDRTLSTTGRSSNGRMRITVNGYDDFGRGRRIAGATVIARRLGTSTRSTYRTGRDGTVLIRVRPGSTYRIDSRASGLIRGFPNDVRAR